MVVAAGKPLFIVDNFPPYRHVVVSRSTAPGTTMIIIWAQPGGATEWIIAKNELLPSRHRPSIHGGCRWGDVLLIAGGTSHQPAMEQKHLMLTLMVPLPSATRLCCVIAAILTWFYGWQLAYNWFDITHNHWSWWQAVVVAGRQGVAPYRGNSFRTNSLTIPVSK